MDDVVIRKCTLRIVRHGGWSWGARRRAIYESATAALPRLIALHLADLLADVEGEIAEPIRLRLALRAGQLASGDGLADVVASGIRAELLPMPAKAATDTHGPALRRGRGSDARRATTPDSRDAVIACAVAASPLAMLLRWREQRVIWQRLEGFSERALELWLSAVLADLPAASATDAGSISQALERDGAAIRRGLPAGAGDRRFVARARLAIAVDLVARHEGAVSAQALARSLDAVIAIAASEASRVDRDVTTDPAPRVAANASEAPPVAREKPVPGPKPPPVAPSFGHGRIDLCSVLPYLVLGVLHRLGWLDVASATLSALDLPDRGRAYATALAYKLLPAPERGWHRSETVLRTAAAFAGARVPASPLELARWSGAAADGLTPLDDFVAAELARGHDCSLPLLIIRVESHHDLPWLLFDADGCLPVAWVGDEATLCNIVRRFGPCVILVSADAASPTLVNGLAADRRSFVTSATPARGDDWRRLKGTACWTGGAQTPVRRLLDAAEMLPELMAHALAITRELLHLRPAAAPREAAALEHSTALAAAIGLGSLAWTLWRDRETVHPLLALARFGNLDGMARSDGIVLEIHPAFGRRYLDLQRHGLLADIPAPPWLGVRRIVFVGP